MAQRNIKKTTEEFIMEAQQVHGNKYEYFKVNYINNKKPVTIICPIHGEFEQSPIRHLKGRGCHKCAKERIANARKGKPQMLSQTEYLDRCISKYGNRYTYEKNGIQRDASSVNCYLPKAWRIYNRGIFLFTR